MVDAAAEREMRWVIALIEEIRSARAQMGVPAGAQLEMLAVELDAAGRRAWDSNAALIGRLARIERLTVAEAVPKGAITVAVEGATLALPLEGVIDVEAETTRLQKALGRLEKDLGGLQGRLNNPKFVASAPEDVVEETREAAAAKAAEAARLKSALERLAAMA
jgi:valyl-tRNA synthetase